MAFAGKMFELAVDTAMSMPNYVESRKDGHGVIYSAGKTVATTLLYASPMTSPIMWGITAAQIASPLGQLTAQIGRNTAMTMSNAYRANFGGNFVDSKGAYTMRQRGMQAIQNSGMNARSILGSEARTYHRSVSDW